MATHRGINPKTLLASALCILFLFGAVSVAQAKTFRFTCQNMMNIAKRQLMVT